MRKNTKFWLALAALFVLAAFLAGCDTVEVSGCYRAVRPARIYSAPNGVFWGHLNVGETTTLTGTVFYDSDVSWAYMAMGGIVEYSQLEKCQ